MVTLGDRIKSSADEVGGLKQLAEMLDVSRRTLGDWVSGASEPKASQLVSICELTSVELDWLLRGIGDKFRDISRKIAESPLPKVAGDDLAVNAGSQIARDLLDEYDVADGHIDSDMLVDIEQAIHNAYANARGAVSRQDALRLSIAWYNQILADGIDLSDGRQIAIAIYEKRKVLEAELKSRAQGAKTASKQ